MKAGAGRVRAEVGQGSLAGRQTAPPPQLSLSVLPFVRVCIASGFELARQAQWFCTDGWREGGRRPPRADPPACRLCAVSSQLPGGPQAPGEHIVCLTCSLWPATQ